MSKFKVVLKSGHRVAGVVAMTVACAATSLGLWKMGPTGQNQAKALAGVWLVVFGPQLPTTFGDAAAFAKGMSKSGGGKKA